MRIESHEYANEANNDDNDVPKPAQSLGTPVPRQKGMFSLAAGNNPEFSLDVQVLLMLTLTAASTQCRMAPTCEQVSAKPAMHVQWASTTAPLCLIMTHEYRGGLLAK